MGREYNGSGPLVVLALSGEQWLHRPVTPARNETRKPRRHTLNVSYSSPIAMGWARMQRMLFRPFRLEAWLTLGLAAFLVNIGNSFGGLCNTFNYRSPHDSGALRLPDETRERLLGWLTNPAVLMGFGAVLIFVLIVMLVFGYVSARAEFVLLENISSERAAFREPWGRFGRLGRSLFLFNAALSFLYILPLALMAVPVFEILTALFRGESLQWSMLSHMLISGSLTALSFLVIGFISLCTQDFVIPIMYQRDIGSRAAWAAFLPLLTSRMGDFVAYALLMLLLGIGVGVAVLVAGLLTCCIGLILVSIPYVSAVVLLPLHAMRRAIGPEFLAQFGEEWVTLHAVQQQQTDDETLPPI